MKKKSVYEMFKSSLKHVMCLGILSAVLYFAVPDTPAKAATSSSVSGGTAVTAGTPSPCADVEWFCIS